jgi:hypothetical protein
MSYTFDIAASRRLRALLRLAEARSEAESAKGDTWQYAVAIDVLRHHVGVNNLDLRRLVNERLIEHRSETTGASEPRRTFRRGGAVQFSTAACFIISPQGARFVQRVFESLRAADAIECDIKPRWDAATGDWTFRGALVKHLRSAASAQRDLLDWCQKQEWCNPIANPWAEMPPRERSRYLCRLLDSLNSRQREAHIHFSSIEKSRSFRWAAIH